MSELLSILLPIMIAIAVVGGYVFASLLLLKYPTILHKKKDIKFKARHISHRGGAGENLENTLAAFQYAKELGTEMLELDCHLTRDKRVVVSHDNQLLRSTGHDILITETNYNDLPPLKTSLILDFDQRYTSDMSKEKADRKIPLLSDIFENFPEMPINIDIKMNSIDLIMGVSRLVEDYKREHITVWGNKSSDINKKCYEYNPNIQTLIPLTKVVGLVFSFYLGLLPFIPLKEGFYEVPMLSAFREEKFPYWEMSRKFQIVLRFAAFLLQSKRMVSHLTARGIQVYFWVLNDEQEFEEAFRLGATGVMTDFPTKLKDFLEKHPDYTE